MNETEAEARRLLAAATEDRPPGLDLLAGFGAARRRGKARRTRRRVAVSAGLMAAAASATAVALTVGSAPPALATITTALTRTLAQSYQVTAQNSWTINGYYHHETCTEQVDPVRKLDASSCSGPPPGFLEVGGYTYLYQTSIAGHPGKHWLRWRQAFQPMPLLGSGPVATPTPQQLLSQLKRLTKVSVTGPVSGPGWTGTRYAFAYGSTQQVRISGTVDVDQQGRARALTLNSRGTRFYVPAATSGGVGGWMPPFVMTQSLTFSDFGAPVIVTPPPTDQTITGPA